MKLDRSFQWLPALALGAWFGLAGLAHTAEPVKPTQPAKASAKTAPKEKTVTVDGEKYVVPEDPQRRDANDLLLKRFDLNGDGKIDEAEIAAAQARLGTNQTPTFTKKDDGRHLTAKDLYEGGDPAKHRAVNRVSSDDLLKRYDLNHDGKLDAREVEQLKRDLEKGGSHATQDLRSGSPPPLPAKPKPVAKQPIR